VIYHDSSDCEHDEKRRHDSCRVKIRHCVVEELNLYGGGSGGFHCELIDHVMCVSVYVCVCVRARARVTVLYVVCIGCV
jgi:hypothetical protein